MDDEKAKAAKENGKGPLVPPYNIKPFLILFCYFSYTLVYTNRILSSWSTLSSPPLLTYVLYFGNI
jgi:hypothetical protein